MKLLKHSGNQWKYRLEPKEGLLLRALVREFPQTAAAPVKISRIGVDTKSAERERLLNESLANHRRELKRLAGKLLTGNLKPGKDGWRLSLSLEEREILLQLINDIRVESWHALGEPEDLEALPAHPSEANLRHHHLMHVAGYFEWQLLGEPVEGRESRDVV